MHCVLTWKPVLLKGRRAVGEDQLLDGKAVVNQDKVVACSQGLLRGRGAGIIWRKQRKEDTKGQVLLDLLDLTFTGNVDGVLGPGLVGCATDYNVPSEDGASVLLEPFPILCASVAAGKYGFSRKILFSDLI